MKDWICYHNAHDRQCEYKSIGESAFYFGGSSKPNIGDKVWVIEAIGKPNHKVHMPVYYYASWLTCKATDVDVEVMIKGYDAIKAKIIEIQKFMVIRVSWKKNHLYISIKLVAIF